MQARREYKSSCTPRETCSGRKRPQTPLQVRIPPSPSFLCCGSLNRYGPRKGPDRVMPLRTKLSPGRRARLPSDLTSTKHNTWLPRRTCKPAYISPPSQKHSLLQFPRKQHLALASDASPATRTPPAHNHYLFSLRPATMTGGTALAFRPEQLKVDSQHFILDAEELAGHPVVRCSSPSMASLITLASPMRDLPQRKARILNVSRRRNQNKASGRARAPLCDCNAPQLAARHVSLHAAYLPGSYSGS